MTNINQSTLSVFVDRAIPEFIRRDHPDFHKFIETFFEFAERQYDLTLPEDEQFDPNPYWVVQNILANNDIDEAYELYLKHIHNELASNWQLVSDNLFFTPYDQARHRQILKLMVDFYRTKGTVNSFEFFFRAIFDKYFDYYLPKQDMLRVSDGKWEEPYLIRIDKIVGSFADEFAEYEELFNAQIVGVESGAVGTIVGLETNVPYAYRPTPNDNKYEVAFNTNEPIYTTTVKHQTTLTASAILLQDATGFTEDDIDVYVDGILIDPVDYTLIVLGVTGTVNFSVAPEIDSVIVISNKGFVQRNWLQVRNLNGDFKEGEQLHVYKPQEDGSYSESYITNFKLRGQSYDPDSDTYYLIDEAEVGISRPEGDWVTEDGFISSRKKIQDSYYYQDYSYEIRTDLSFVDFNLDLKRSLHPAGFIVFNKYTEETYVEGTSPGTIELADDHHYVHIAEDDIPAVVTPSVEKITWQIDIGDLKYAGLDWGLLDRHKTTKYNTYLTTIKRDEQESGSLNPLRPLDFRINGPNNHNLVWVDKEVVSERYSDEDTNYFSIYGQYLDFFQPTSGEVYVFNMKGIKRDLYNEHTTLIANDGTVAGISSFIHEWEQGLSSIDEQDVIVLVEGVGKLRADGVAYTVDEDEFAVSYVENGKLDGKKVILVVFNNDELKYHTVAGNNTNTYAAPGSWLPLYKDSYLVFANGQVVPDNEYILEDGNFVFNTSYKDTEYLEIYTF